MIEILKRYAKIIRSYRIEKYEQFGLNLRLRAVIEFTDYSSLHIRETIINGRNRKYSYHWQTKSQKLIIRWDNAPDWDIETFPHHKHIKNEVQPSYERTLEQVLTVIEKKLIKTAAD